GSCRYRALIFGGVRRGGGVMLHRVSLPSAPRRTLNRKTRLGEGPAARSYLDGGEGEIRTLGTGSPYTRFPGVLLQPLGHLSIGVTPGRHRLTGFEQHQRV